MEMVNFPQVTEEVPDDWWPVIVVPLFKMGNRSKAGNYKPRQSIFFL